MDALNIRLAADGSLPTAAKSAGIVGTIQAQKPTWSHSSTETSGSLFSKGTISHPYHRLSLHLFSPLSSVVQYSVQVKHKYSVQGKHNHR